MRPGFRLAASLLFLLSAACLLLFLVLDLFRSGQKDWVPLETGGTAERRVVMLVVDRLDYATLRAGAGPALQALLEQGAVTLLNARTGRSTSESGYLSLGSGSRAAAGPEGGEAFELEEKYGDESAGEVYRRRTGLPPAGELVHLRLAELQERNRGLDYTVSPGLLGQKLAAGGLQAAVFGNADTSAPGRSAVLIAMDQSGTVPLGRIGNGMLARDPLAPYGKRTDTENLASSVQSVPPDTGLIVLEFGDTTRLDSYWPYLSAEQREVLLTATMDRLDRLVERLKELLLPGDLLIMLAPSPPAAISGNSQQLLPVLFYSKSTIADGLVVSPGTRRPGIIANTDLTPFVLSYLRIPPETAAAAAPGGDRQAVLHVVPVDDKLSYLDRLYERTLLVYRQRPFLLRVFVISIIILVLAGLAGLALRQRLTARVVALLEALMVFPPVLLLLPAWPAFPFASPALTAAVTAGAVLLAVLLLHPLKRRSRYLYWAVLGTATAAVLLADTLAGAHLQQVSFLSYDPVGGARYYGVGNEYMGVLIGSTVLGTVSLAALLTAPGAADAGPETAPRRAAAVPLLAALGLLYLATIFVLASPRYGANFGGTIAASVAFGTAFFGLMGILYKKGAVQYTAALFPLLAAVLLWTLNLCWEGELPSHLGQFEQAVRLRGLAELRETAWRKAAMNWRLIRYSIWSRVFVALLGLLAVLFFYPVGVLRRLKQEQPFLINLVAGGLAGAVMALLVNDSGVVAAAMILLYTGPPMLVVIVDRVMFEAG